MRAGLFACEQGSWLAGYSIRRVFHRAGWAGDGKGGVELSIKHVHLHNQGDRVRLLVASYGSRSRW